MAFERMCARRVSVACAIALFLPNCAGGSAKAGCLEGKQAPRVSVLARDGAFCVAKDISAVRLASEGPRLVLPMERFGGPQTIEAGTSFGYWISLGRFSGDAIYLGNDRLWFLSDTAHAIVDLADSRMATAPDCAPSRGSIERLLMTTRVALGLELPVWCRSTNPAASGDSVELPCLSVNEFYPGENRNIEYPATSGTYLSVVVSGGSLGLHAHKFDLGKKVDCSAGKFDVLRGELVGSIARVQLSRTQHPWISIRATGCVGVLVGRLVDSSMTTETAIERLVNSVVNPSSDLSPQKSTQSDATKQP